MIRLALVIFVGFASLSAANAQYLPSEVCTGTFSGLSTSTSDVAEALAYLKLRYSGCKKVDGNLEIVVLQPNTHALWYNASEWEFLNNIVEVTGYVLISRVGFTTLPLRSLRLIRGEYLLQPTNKHDSKTLCSLCLVLNPNLQSFGFQALTEIRRGNVFILMTPVKYVHKVYWEDLFLPPPDGMLPQTYSTDSTNFTNGTCHPDCESSYCFGPTAAECHYSTRVTCPSCTSRCLPRTSICCYQTCVAGCFNSTDYGCVTCEKVRNEGRCVSECPKRFVSDYRGRPRWNPNYKVAFAGECLKNCPSHLVDDGGECFTQCREGSRELANGTCVACLPDEKCPTHCEGNDVPKAVVNFKTIDYMTNDSIARFRNCTHVSGNININLKIWSPTSEELLYLKSVQVVTGYVWIHASNVHSLYSDYSFLSNLTTVHGRYLRDGYSVQLVDYQSPVKQLALRSLNRISFGSVGIFPGCGGLRVNWTRLFLSPERQKFFCSRSCVPEYTCSSVCDPTAGCWGPGDDMCVACRDYRFRDACVTTCNMTTSGRRYYVSPLRTCELCNAQCAGGCVGPNPDECVGGCRNFYKNGTCVETCGNDYWSAKNKTCYLCHPNCEKGCGGPHEHLKTEENSDGCFDCFRTIVRRDGSKVCGSRVTKCEIGYATDPKGADANLSGVLCTQCEEKCYDCGNNSRKCQVCNSARIIRSGVPPRIPMTDMMALLYDAGYTTNTSNITLPPEDTNVFTKYKRAYRAAIKTKPYMLEDAPCTSLDSSLETFPGSFGCPSEAHVTYFLLWPKFNLTCYQLHSSQLQLAEATSIEKVDETTNGTKDYLKSYLLPAFRPCRSGDLLCVQCPAECRDGCSGPLASDCNNCTVSRVYKDPVKNQGPFSCVLKCPPDLPWLWDHESGVAEPFCTATMPPDEKRKVVVIVTTVSVVVVLLVIAAVVTAVMLRKRAHDKMKTRKFEREMAGVGAPAEPLLESNAAPDMAKLRLIKLTELKRGDVIGSGAFGTVYRGLWVPEGENVKIPVAIKLLTESSARANAEFVDEVRVMATVVHPCCIRIAGVCMSEQPQLVTPLMRHGSLLDFLRQHESTLGARVMLNWATQIALGMSYLEERGVVHRDLAARNVLVHSINQVKITDFGLAKLLDVNEAEYHATGGKLPIKWLALECITERRFTHKSDVWAYGVTLWEMFTFGARPYDGTNARDMPELLLHGDRLAQPGTCSIDVYMVMLKCWMTDPTSRPSFRELADEFARMARDPARFLHIENDKLSRPPTSIDPNTSSHDDALLARLLGTCGDDSGGENLRVMHAEDYLNPLGSAEDSVDPEGRVTMSALLARNVDSSTDTSAPPTYSAQFNMPPPPGHAPPPPPDAGIRYAALEVGKDRQSRLKNARTDSIDGRYAQDPVTLVNEIEREAERNRLVEEDNTVHLRKPAATNAAAPVATATPPPKTLNSRPAFSTPLADAPAQDYLEPRGTDGQSGYVDMREQPRVAVASKALNGAQPGRQTTPAGNLDTKPKIPAKAHDSVNTNLNILAPAKQAPKTTKSQIDNFNDSGDTYLVPAEARQPEKDAGDTYVNMGLSARATAPTAASTSSPAKLTPAVAQNPDYFVTPSVTAAPKASVDEDLDDDENDQSGYVNMNDDAQRRLIRR